MIGHRLLWASAAVIGEMDVVLFLTIVNEIALISKSACLAKRTLDGLEQVDEACPGLELWMKRNSLEGDCSKPSLVLEGLAHRNAKVSVFDIIRKVSQVFSVCWNFLFLFRKGPPYSSCLRVISNIPLDRSGGDTPHLFLQ